MVLPCTRPLSRLLAVNFIQLVRGWRLRLRLVRGVLLCLVCLPIRFESCSTATTSCPLWAWCHPRTAWCPLPPGRSLRYLWCLIMFAYGYYDSLHLQRLRLPCWTCSRTGGVLFRPLWSRCRVLFVYCAYGYFICHRRLAHTLSVVDPARACSGGWACLALAWTYGCLIGFCQVFVLSFLAI